jgi:hypothetical protein
VHNPAQPGTCLEKRKLNLPAWFTTKLKDAVRGRQSANAAADYYEMLHPDSPNNVRHTSVCRWFGGGLLRMTIRVGDIRETACIRSEGPAFNSHVREGVEHEFFKAMSAEGAE